MAGHGMKLAECRHGVVLAVDCPKCEGSKAAMDLAYELQLAACVLPESSTHRALLERAAARITELETAPAPPPTTSSSLLLDEVEARAWDAYVAGMLGVLDNGPVPHQQCGHSRVFWSPNEVAERADAAIRLRRARVSRGLIDRVETDAGTVDAADDVEAKPQGRQRRPRRSTVRPSANGKALKKTDRAEAFVFAHPEGVTALDVGGHVGQNARTAESTLRQVMKRKTIVRRRGKWYPAGKRSESGAKITNRAAIIEVLSGGKALGTADIFRGVQKLLENAVKTSIAAEIQRMKTNGAVVERGRGARGALYGLPTGGAATAAAN